MESFGKLVRSAVLLIVVPLSADCQDKAIAAGPAPDDAYLEGSKLPYYGSEETWDRRFFYAHIETAHFRPGRSGQRQMLDIIEGRPKEAIEYCQQRYQEDPNDLESLFNLTVAWCKLNDREKALAAMQQALDAGLPFERFLAGPRDLLKPLTSTPEFRRLSSERAVQLIHGPLLGCVTDESAGFWVRTVDEVPIQVVASTSKDLAEPVRSQPVASRAARDYTAVASLHGLKANSRYYYDLVVDGKPTLGPEYPSFRTYAAAGRGARFQVGFGGGASYVWQNERMWETIRSRNLAAFLFMGDNVYIDMPQQSGAFHNYTYYRRQSHPAFRRLVSTTPIFAIWDDHDAAIDDVFLGPYVDKPSWKPSMWQLFRNNWNNPAYGDGEEHPGCWFKFSIADVDFYMLDGRFYRTNPHLENPTMLGPRQKAWLLRELASSQATFKVLASPVPWAFDTKDDALDTWNGFRAERNEIFNFLRDNAIDGVVLISADRHRSDARRIARENAYPLYEFESSRLTNVHFHEPVGETLFVYTDKCSFGTLSFDTTLQDPEVTFEISNIDDVAVYELTLKKSALADGAEETRP